MSDEAFCVPVLREKENVWRIFDVETGRGVYGSVRAACKRLKGSEDCSYVFKIIPLSKRFTERAFKREVRAQQLLAAKGLAMEVIDYWICPDKSRGVIIMKVLDMTAEKFLTESDSTVEDQIRLIGATMELLNTLHKSGYYHGDAHLGNIMLKKVMARSGPNTFHSSLGTFRVYLVDMGKTGSLKRPGKIMGRTLTAQNRIDTDLKLVMSEFKTYAREAVKQL